MVELMCVCGEDVAYDLCFLWYISTAYGRNQYAETERIEMSEHCQRHRGSLPTLEASQDKSCRGANRGLLAAGARGLVDRCGNLLGGNECKTNCHGDKQFILKQAAFQNEYKIISRRCSLSQNAAFVMSQRGQIIHRPLIGATEEGLRRQLIM